MVTYIVSFTKKFYQMQMTFTMFTKRFAARGI